MWRERIQTEEAKSIYRERPSTAEFPNADCRNLGLQQFRGAMLAKGESGLVVACFEVQLDAISVAGCRGTEDGPVTRPLTCQVGQGTATISHPANDQPRELTGAAP